MSSRRFHLLSPSSSWSNQPPYECRHYSPNPGQWHKIVDCLRPSWVALEPSSAASGTFVLMTSGANDNTILRDTDSHRWKYMASRTVCTYMQVKTSNLGHYLLWKGSTAQLDPKEGGSMFFLSAVSIHNKTSRHHNTKDQYQNAYWN
jgi:hypothetical protein